LGRGLGWVTPEVPPNPDHSVILSGLVPLSPGRQCSALPVPGVSAE